MSRPSRTERQYAIEGELDDPRESPHAWWGPYRRTRPMTSTRWQRFKRWLQATFPTWRNP